VRDASCCHYAFLSPFPFERELRANDVDELTVDSPCSFRILSRSAEADATVERAALRLIHQPFVGSYQESAGSARAIADSELLVCARVRLHATHDRLNQNARSEVLTRGRPH
jgi:hypothetical protein